MAVLDTPVQPVHLMHPDRDREVQAIGREVPRSRRRREAILVKVKQESDWLQIYRRIMEARSSLEGAIGVRRTRAGHILIEFDGAVAVNEAAAKLRAALSDTTEVAALVNRLTLQIKNIDSPTTKEELVEEIRLQWGTPETMEVEVKSMKMAPWGTQVAVVVLPANGVPGEDRERKLKTGLTVASIGQLSNIQRCFRCHMLGHVAARCTVACAGRELCRKCGSSEHVMSECTSEPRSAMCVKMGGANVRHITGSLVCPVVRLGIGTFRRGRN